MFVSGQVPGTIGKLTGTGPFSLGLATQLAIEPSLNPLREWHYTHLNFLLWSARGLQLRQTLDRDIPLISYLHGHITILPPRS